MIKWGDKPLSQEEVKAVLHDQRRKVAWLDLENLIQWNPDYSYQTVSPLAIRIIGILL